jgi:hypothetical protein
VEELSSPHARSRRAAAADVDHIAADGVGSVHHRELQRAVERDRTGKPRSRQIDPKTQSADNFGYAARAESGPS